MAYRITLEQETFAQTGNLKAIPPTEFKVKTQVVSDEPAVIAGTLRALADMLDPPKNAHRGRD